MVHLDVFPSKTIKENYSELEKKLKKVKKLVVSFVFSTSNFITVHYILLDFPLCNVEKMSLLFECATRKEKIKYV